MLYRHPFLCPFPTSTPLTLSSPHPCSSSSHHSKIMEPVEGLALNTSSFGPEISLKTAPPSPVNNPQNVAVLGDDFFVDDLLDFSNAVIEDPFDQKQQESFDNDHTTVTKAEAPASNITSVTFPVKDVDFGSLPASGLSVPADDLESLEWLSNFVDDSLAGYCPVTKLQPEPAKAKTEPEILVQKKPCFNTPVQTKARSKRTRAGFPGWALGSHSLSESSTSSSTSITTSSSSLPWFFYSSGGQGGQTQTAESLLYGKPPVKKKQKNKWFGTEFSTGGGGGHHQARRCSHCGVQKTPQWRAGPLGVKTLCNACGVRYKSGRLLPEYRPACSPTFSSELHSNNHRKVLEMRRQKEVEEAGLAPPVQSF